MLQIILQSLFAGKKCYAACIFGDKLSFYTIQLGLFKASLNEPLIYRN
jgi:hypothetical protein